MKKRKLWVLLIGALVLTLCGSLARYIIDLSTRRVEIPAPAHQVEVPDEVRLPRVEYALSVTESDITLTLTPTVVSLDGAPMRSLDGFGDQLDTELARFRRERKLLQSQERFTSAILVDRCVPFGEVLPWVRAIRERNIPPREILLLVHGPPTPGRLDDDEVISSLRFPMEHDYRSNPQIATLSLAVSLEGLSIGGVPIESALKPGDPPDCEPSWVNALTPELLGARLEGATSSGESTPIITIAPDVPTQHVARVLSRMSSSCFEHDDRRACDAMVRVAPSER